MGPEKLRSDEGRIGAEDKKKKFAPSIAGPGWIHPALFDNITYYNFSLVSSVFTAASTC